MLKFKTQTLQASEKILFLIKKRIKKEKNKVIGS